MENVNSTLTQELFSSLAKWGFFFNEQCPNIFVMLLTLLQSDMLEDNGQEVHCNIFSRAARSLLNNLRLIIGVVIVIFPQCFVKYVALELLMLRLTSARRVLHRKVP